MSVALIESFIEMLLAERGASVNTVQAYARDMRDYRRWCKSHNVAMETATRADIESYLASLSKAALAASTMARKLSCLKQFYRFLYEDRVREDNPTATIRAPKQGRSLPKVLSVQQVDSLLAAARTMKGAEGTRIAALMEMLYASGLRVSELVSMKLAHVQQNAAKAHGLENFMIIKGKGAKERLVPLNKRAVKALAAYLEVRPHFLRGTEESPWLFPSTAKSGHLTRQRFGQLLKELAYQAKLDPTQISPHTLRHSFASHLLAGGADLRVIQELLGHADISTTQIYTHVANSRLEELVTTKHPLAEKLQ